MRKRVFAFFVFIIIIFSFCIFSYTRIESVNENLHPEESDYAVAHQEESSKTNTVEYHLGDKVDMSGVKQPKGTIPQGVKYTFSNALIKTENDLSMEYDGWATLFGPSGNKYDDPMYLELDMKIENDSNEAFYPIWFKAESHPWSTVLDPNATYLENHTEDREYFLVNPGETKIFIISYQLWEPVFSDGQWEEVRSLPYSLTYLDYPIKIIVHLDEVAS